MIWLQSVDELNTRSVAMNRREFGAAVLGLPALIRPAAAAARIVLGKQYGLPFLPQMVMEAHKLIEKHAERNGVPGLSVGWETMGGPGALNDALLTGQIQFVTVAAPSLATLWDKTVGTPQEVRALCAVQSMPYVLVTRNPAVKTIADLTADDRIAVPTVKISGQAMALQMAAAQRWGFEQYERLDPLTVSLGHPDALAAMLSGQITTHFASAPFQYYELKLPGFRVVLKSYETTGGRHTNGLQVMTKRFHDANPAVCAAVLAAQDEANAFIRAQPHEAARIYRMLANDKRSSEDELTEMITDPDIEYTTAPAALMTLVSFMHKVGRIKRLPPSWHDLFFPEAHGLNGSQGG
jgi:NitT/TauT family transport system substrate-binding protein